MTHPPVELPILVVDDEEVVRATMHAILTHRGYTVETVEDADLALQRLEAGSYLMAITDVMMPHMSGLEFLVQAHQHDPELPVIVMTGYPTVERVVEALRNGAVEFIVKPFDVEALMRAVDRVANARKRREIGVATQAFITSDIRMQMPSTLTHIAGAVDFLCQRSVLTDFYPADVGFQIKLALGEALANAHRHGNHEDETRFIRVQASVDAEKCEIVVEDDGEGFDPGRVPSPLMDDRILSCGGRGLFLIACYMDGYEHNARGNRIRMWKLHPAAARPVPDDRPASTRVEPRPLLMGAC